MPPIKFTPLRALRNRTAASVLCLTGLAAALPGAAAAQDAYGVGPGDVLRIEVLEDETLNRTVLVGPDGRISVPLAGSIRARGRTVEAIQNILAARLADDFAETPNVFVSLEQLAPPRPAGPPPEAPVISVFVVGEAGTTGEIEVSPGTTLLQMFGVMNGFTRFAATKRIQLRRDGRTYPVNYEAIERGISPNGNTPLADGDVIVVPQRRLFE